MAVRGRHKPNSADYPDTTAPQDYPETATAQMFLIAPELTYWQPVTIVANMSTGERYARYFEAAIQRFSQGTPQP